ncbi:MAG: hypothetical protein KDJ87_05885 [Rhizobiaceae bacterium]|nr:hypothetical protein [Rhizobiaceae bacterium]
MITFEKSVLSSLLVNATHDIDMGENGRATIYYETDRLAHMRRPDGVVMSGDWSLLDDGYAIAWRGGPVARWRLKAAPGRISYVDAEGRERGAVRSISFGNTACLPG